MVKAVQELLKSFVCNLPYRARFEIRHLNHTENTETLLPVVKLDVGKFIERDISVFIFLDTDYDEYGKDMCRCPPCFLQE